MTRSFLRQSCAAAALLSVYASPALAVVDEPEADTIVVTASPLTRDAESLVSPVSVIEGDELRRNVAASLGETLRREPGVSATGFGQGASRPIIRGLGGDRVRTLTNGLGSFDAAAASPDHGVPIEPLFAERIEVVRGSGLLRYGNSAAGGVVNVLDGRIPTAVPEDGLDVSARAAYGTVDESTELSGAARAALGKIGGWDVVFSASGATRDAEDYEIPGMAESARFRALEEMEEHEGEDHDHDEHEHDEGDEGVLGNSFVETDTYA
ncbi:MAG: TonB-dependent receptor plug domain-containing protein, partial [Parvularcula sp.]|nr:TonB-dependent receptor plug domain-containing protein [Parvularcula sp.]